MSKIIVTKSNYSGEVLEMLLTKAVTQNELVARGLIHVEPGVSPAGFHIPRLRTGKMLQKHKAMPTADDAKGEFKYDEVTLKPEKFMAFTTFNPTSFESVWRRFQPKGNLVFAQLPDEVQETLISELLKQVQFELGDHMINGCKGPGPEQFFDGILTRITSNNEVIRVNSEATKMIDRLREVYKAIPVAIKQNPSLRILMSQEDFDTYDNELTDLHHKGASVTDTNPERFKGKKIEVLTQWPQGVIVATICGSDFSSNLFAACNLDDDPNVVQIDKLSNAGEVYFFKLLMTMDTNIAFGDEVVLLDFRSTEKVKKFITATPTTMIFNKEGGEAVAIIRASGEYDIAGSHEGFDVSKVEGGILVKAGANDTGSERIGTVELTLKGSEEKAIVEVMQGDGK